MRFVGALAIAGLVATPALAQTGVYSGRNEGQVTLTVGPKTANAFKVELFTGVKDRCSGTLDGTAVKTNQANVYEMRVPSDDQVCKVRLTFNGARASIKTDACSAFHGQECRFDGAVAKVADAVPSAPAPPPPAPPAATPAPTTAQLHNPESLIMVIYLAHDQKGGPWEPSIRGLGNFFTPELLAKVKQAKDAATEPDDYFLPFYPAQDSFPTRLDLKTLRSPATPNRAVVNVSFGMDGDDAAKLPRERLRYILTKGDKGWRIAEVMVGLSGEGLSPYSLRLENREVDLSLSGCKGEFGTGSGVAGSTVGAACRLEADTDAERDVQAICRQNSQCDVHGKIILRGRFRYITEVWDVVENAPPKE